jgi:hypothetical protein
MAESPATRMMRSHASIPNMQTPTIVGGCAKYEYTLHRMRQSVKAQNRFAGFDETRISDSVPLWESPNTDFRKNTKAATRKLRTL